MTYILYCIQTANNLVVIKLLHFNVDALNK